MTIAQMQEQGFAERADGGDLLGTLRVRGSGARRGYEVRAIGGDGGSAYDLEGIVVRDLGHQQIKAIVLLGDVDTPDPIADIIQFDGTIDDQPRILAGVVERTLQAVHANSLRLGSHTNVSPDVLAPIFGRDPVDSTGTTFIFPANAHRAAAGDQHQLAA